MRFARLNWPPISPAASNSVTAWPRSAAVVAQARPAGPAPTTATRFGCAAGATANSASRHAAGLTRHEAVRFSKMWSRHAWLHAMHVLISSARPAIALFTNSASARNGRAIDTMSASPRASTLSATAGSLMRLVVTSGTRTLPLRRRVTQVNAARGTIVAIVGTRASCQPMPVLMIVAPAPSTAFASSTISSQVLPPSTRSSIDSRKITMKSGPTASRTARTVVVANRMRFA